MHFLLSDPEAVHYKDMKFSIQEQKKQAISDMTGAVSLSHFKEKQQKKKGSQVQTEYHREESELSEDTQEEEENEKPSSLSHMMSVLTESEEHLLSYTFDI